MKSSTAMPAHSTTRRRGSEGNATLHPGADDVVGDRDRHRRGETVGMLPYQHQRDLLAVEPARVCELARIDRDLLRERLGVAADHQRARERPWLRCEIAHAPAN